MEKPAAPARFWSLDALRGGCAIVVFLSHWHLWCAFAPVGAGQNFIHAFLQNCHEWLIFTTWPTGGHHPAVLAFFVLSGFCIHYPAEWRLAHGNRTLPAGDYYRRRFLRIMPVYWVASLLGLLLVGLEWWWPTGNALLQFHAQAPLPHIVVRFLAIAGFYPEEIFVGNYILNTIAAEIVMYAAYPFFHRLAMDGRWRALGLGFVLMHAFAIGLLRLGFSPYWAFNSLFMLGLFWFAGALAAHGFVARRWRLAGWWVLIAWIGFLLVKAVTPFYGLNLIKQAMWGLVCVVALLWVLTFEERHGTWRRQQIVGTLCYGGTISYSLYAVHTPVMLITTWFLLRVAGCENYLVQLAVTLLAAAGATVACYYLVEHRFYRPRIMSAPPAAP
ncbi:MAG: acyltransferase [Lacunisphaera sp.]|nr:acyltransferase [Lacunisphaera sp.]